MAEDRLIIEGKSFISSMRAARLFGYTKDYVGQLARAGKIASQLIGRSWYVDEDSIRKHKLSVHYTLTKPKKPRKNFPDGDEKKNVTHNEMSIEHIDISGTTRAQVGVNMNEMNKETHGVSRYDIGQEVTDKEYDLFPRPIRGNTSDALVRSEFVYEPNPSAPYIEDIMSGIRALHIDTIPENRHESGVNQIEQKKHSSGGIIRTIKTGTGGVRRAKEQVNVVAMDGIIVPDGTPPRTRTMYDDGVLGAEDGTHEHENAHHDGVDDEEEYDTESRPSRLLPISGSIILFLVLTTIYLLL